MVAAVTAYKLTFGIDRATNPWPDLAAADVILIAGSNTAECAPITTHYLWQCRERGGRLIVVDPRMTPISRNADLFLPVRPGTDLALFLATGNVGREGAGCMMITGQGNGQGGREHGQKADQLPGMRSITDPEHRKYVAGVWGVPPESLPGPGLSAAEIMEAIHRGEIKALFSMCFNPLVSLPDATFTREALSKLEFFAVIDFFLSETAHHADLVFCGSMHEEDEGVVCSAEGRVQKINKAVNPPGDARSDALIICDLAARLGKGQYFAYPSTREIYEELRIASKGGIADYYGITWERIEDELGVFWPCPEIGHPGTPRLFENGRFYHADGKAHLQAAEWRESGDPLDASFPLLLTTGRVVSHYLSGTQTRRIGPLVEQYPEPRIELHPRLAEEHGIANGDWVRITTRRAALVAQTMVVKTIRPDTIFIPYHWPGRRSANLLTHRTLDPRSKIPEFKVSACRIEKVPPPADLDAWRLEETGWVPGAKAADRRGA